MFIINTEYKFVEPVTFACHTEYKALAGGDVSRTLLSIEENVMQIQPAIST